jgi:hypothetical protein
MWVTFLPLDCNTNVSGHDSQQQITHLTDIKHENSTVHTTMKIGLQNTNKLSSYDLPQIILPAHTSSGILFDSSTTLIGPGLLIFNAS